MNKEECIVLELPLPPSTNQLYSTIKTNWKTKRVKTKKYKNWFELATYEMLNQKKYEICWNNWLKWQYNFFMKIYNKDWSKKKIDTDNRVKALQDLLEHNIKWFEDKHILEFTAKKIDSDKNIVKLIIREI